MIPRSFGWESSSRVLSSLFYFSDNSLPIVQLPVKEGEMYLWGKTKKAFKYIYSNYFKEADWIIKAEVDT